MRTPTCYLCLLGIAAAALLSPASLRAAEPPAIERPAPPPGMIEADLRDFQLDLLGDRGRQTFHGREGRAEVPRGRYILMRWSFTRRDGQGRVWEATFAPPQYNWFEVGEKPVRFTLDGDLTAVTTAQPAGSMTAFTLHFENGAGRLQALTVAGAKPPEPGLRIIEERSKRLVARITPTASCCFTFRAAWPTPPELRGTFRVTPATEFGPFAVKTVRAATFRRTDATAALGQPQRARIGQEAPDFSLPRIGGSTNLRPFRSRGRPFILLFSCGCAPCEEAARRLAAAPDLKQQAEVALVVTNQYAAMPEAAQQFRERSGYHGPMLADDGKVSAAYDAAHCPKLWLLDAAGIARWTGGGASDKRSPEALVAELLAEVARRSKPVAPPDSR